MKKQLIILSLFSLFSIEISYASVEQSVLHERQEILEQQRNFRLEFEEIRETQDAEKLTNLAETINTYLSECVRLGFDSQYKRDYIDIKDILFLVLSCEFLLIYKTIDDINSYEKFKKFKAKALLMDETASVNFFDEMPNELYQEMIKICDLFEDLTKQACKSGQYLYPPFDLPKFPEHFKSLPSPQAYKNAFLSKYNNIRDIKNFEEFKDIALSFDELIVNTADPRHNLNTRHFMIFGINAPLKDHWAQCYSLEDFQKEIIPRIYKLETEFYINPSSLLGGYDSFLFTRTCKKYFSFNLLI